MINISLVRRRGVLLTGNKVEQCRPGQEHFGAYPLHCPELDVRGVCRKPGIEDVDFLSGQKPLTDWCWEAYGQHIVDGGLSVAYTVSLLFPEGLCVYALAQNVVHAVVLHQATTKPKKRPKRFPPASAAHR